MNEAYNKIAEAATEARVKAISYNMEIALDNLKYSSWISALGTAAIALIITNFEKIVDRSWVFKDYAVYVVIFAGMLQLLGLAVGAAINWQINQSLGYLRVRTALFEKQNLELLCKEDMQDDLSTVKDKILAASYLNDDDKKLAQELRHKAEKPPYRTLILTQQVVTIGGYLLIFASALKHP